MNKNLLYISVIIPYQITPTLCEYLMDCVLEHNYEDKIIVNCLVILYGAYFSLN